MGKLDHHFRPLLPFFQTYQSGGLNVNDHYIKNQFLGAMAPLARMGKDLVETFEPYKSRHYVTEDAMQGVRGFENLGTGLLGLVGAPLSFIVNTAMYLPHLSHPRDFAAHMKSNAIYSSSWFLRGVTDTLRGLTQMATAPFILLRIPFRAIMTAYKGQPKIEENQGIKKKIDAAQTLLFENKVQSSAQISLALRQIHRKFEKAITKGQHSNVEIATEQQAFAELNVLGNLNREKVTGYLNLFSKVKTPAASPMLARPVPVSRSFSK